MRSLRNRKVRAYTLLRNVRGKGSASAHRRGLSRPCTHDEGRSCPPTLTIAMEANPTRIGYAPEPCCPGPALGWPCPRDPCVGAFAPQLPRPGAVAPLDPDHSHGGQPYADWMRASPLPPWTGPRSALPPGPPRVSFRAPAPTTGMALPAVAERFGVRSRAGARPLHPGLARRRAGKGGR
jgi:hypothetical protein